MSQIKTVKEATDIVEIIGERLELQKGGSNLKAPCPFHSEKTPSFFVNSQMQRFRCFGCGETGDVFEFLQKYEGMTFYESLEYLADRANITLEKKNIQNRDDQDREQVLAALNLAKEYYHYLLVQHKAGRSARDYLEDRGIAESIIQQFQLGAAPTGWDGLLKYLHGKKKYSLKTLEQAGLILKGKRGGYYDRFRGRLMFPLKNHRGQVVGFSGRVLDPTEKQAKYINSPETMVYHKSQMLFGLSEQFQAIRKAEEAVVVEGEFDVLSSVKAKVPQVVAIKGSALTEEQVKLLKRVVKRIILALDRDEAGIEASRRAITVATTHDLELRVADPTLMTGKDPDDLARENPKAWRQAVKQSISVYDFLLQMAIDQFDASTPEGKKAIIKSLAQPFTKIPHAVEFDVYLKKLASQLNVRSELVKQDLQTEAKKQKLTGRRVSTTTKSKPKAKPGTRPLSRQARLEEYTIFLLLHSQPKTWPDKVGQLEHVSFAQPALHHLVQLLRTKSVSSVSQLIADLPEDIQQQVFELHTHPIYFPRLESIKISDEWPQTVAELRQLDIAHELQKISAELAELDRVEQKNQTQENRQAELLGKISQLKRKQARL